jgi:patatin-like phospholipase/acyl hydrolase
MAAVTAGTAQAVATTNQVFHDIVGYVGDKYDELQRDLSGLAIGQANLLAHQNECCGGLTRQLMQNNYDAAMRDAATNANITAMGQKVLDAIMGNKIEAMQNRINQLELQN